MLLRKKNHRSQLTEASFNVNIEYINVWAIWLFWLVILNVFQFVITTDAIFRSDRLHYFFSLVA